MNYKKTIIPPIGEEERKRIMENALYGIKENIKKPKGVKQDKKITREEHNKRLSIANKNSLKVKHALLKGRLNSPLFRVNENTGILEAKKGEEWPFSGENHYNWKGGITPVGARIRMCFKYRQWRDDVFTRDDYTCQYCGDNSGGNLNAHHIKSFKDILQKYEITNTKQANDCAELWNINNGVTLCGECHRKLHQGEIEL